MGIAISHDHVGLAVTRADLDTTIEWYSANFGFTVDSRFRAHGTEFVFLVSGDVKIELVAGADSRQAAPSDLMSSMGLSRMHHFCIAVADLDAAISRLREREVDLIGGPMEIADIGQRIAFVTDNLGNIIELTEPGGRPPAALRPA